MTDRSRPAGAPDRNFYGRRHGKTMNKVLFTYLDEDLAGLSPGPVDYEVNPDRQLLDIKSRYGDKPIWLEIGFGGGEHLIHQAIRNPDVEIIGCEPFINGVATLLGKIRKSGVSNLSVYPSDVRDLFDVLPDASIARTFLLYPDPWPKSRHHRRRFVTPDHLGPLARVMKKGAIFRVATDIQDYVHQTLEEVPVSGFERVAGTEADLHTPWDDWLSTRYEKKALRAGRKPHYLTFHRV